MKRSLCHVPGCFNFTDTRYCEAHAYKQAEDDRRAADGATKRWAEHHAKAPESAAIWQSARWKRISREYLARHPVCEWPGCGERARSVDHIVPHKGDEALAYDTGNLQALCKAHHDAKSRRDRG